MAFDYCHTTRNTWSMDQQPQSPEEHHDLDTVARRTLTLRIVLSGEMFRDIVCYPVIVEAWDKRNQGFRRRTAWLSQFTEAERNTLSRYYGRFYRWHLVTGTPRQVACRTKTIGLLQRAVAFFASI